MALFRKEEVVDKDLLRVVMDTKGWGNHIF